MPEKPFLIQVGPSGTWSNWRDRTDGSKLGRVLCEVWMDLGEQYRPTGCHRIQPTADTVSAVSHPE